MLYVDTRFCWNKECLSTPALLDDDNDRAAPPASRRIDEKVGDEKVGDEKVTDEKVGDEKGGDEKGGDEKVTDEKVTDEKVMQP